MAHLSVILSMAAAQVSSSVSAPPRILVVPAPALQAVPSARLVQPSFTSAIASVPGQPNKYQRGNIIISFEGGVVGEDLGAALLRLAQAPNLLGTVEHAVAEGESPCSIMIALGYPQPCSAGLLKSLDLLNPKLLPSRGHLHSGDLVLLPDAWVRPYRTGRAFSGTVSAEQRRSSAIKKGWSHLNLNVAKISGASERVDFDAFDLIIPTSDVRRQMLMLQRVAPLKSANVRINSVPFTAAPAKAYSIEDAGVYQQQCSQVPPTVPQTIDYHQYADADGDAAALVSQRPPGSRPALVYLLDVALDPSPNLDGAVAGAAAGAHQAWHCSWSTGIDPRRHSTHLAGIIASRGNGFGFVGLSPTSTIVSYELLTPSATAATGLDMPPGRDLQLADLLSDTRDSQSPQVFLVATSFPYARDFPASAQTQPERRFDRQLEHNIEQLKPLFVVAAGQNPHPIPLSPRAAMSPQNLGDQRNVIIVTACDNCSRASPTLLREANFSMEGGGFVHVAAPGGRPMLGWVDHQSIGAANGTSQAAAFAAGVVAEMIGRWPANYLLPENVKKRLQVTSWPLYAQPGLPSSDSDHVATGIVDPLLALLDPSVTWFKDDQGWHQIRLKGFSSDTLALTQTSGAQTWIPAKSVARIVRISLPGDPALYVVYSDASRRFHNTDRLGEVDRDGPLQADPALAVLPCTGPPIPMSGVTDLIVSYSAMTAQQCG